MWILMLEAIAALFVLVFIVWWTMFHGRGPNRPRHDHARQENDTPRD